MAAKKSRKWKAFRAQRKRAYSRQLESTCADECGHLAERAGAAYERGRTEAASKLLGTYTKCKRSCYIRRSETAHVRSRRG